MDYPSWIERERRIRLKILEISPAIRSSRIYRVCRECNEICLCHEERCPNCNSPDIDVVELGSGVDVGTRIRCRHRFFNLEGAINKP